MASRRGYSLLNLFLEFVEERNPEAVDNLSQALQGSPVVAQGGLDARVAHQPGDLEYVDTAVEQ